MAGTALKVLQAHALELGPQPHDSGPWTNWRLTRDSDGVAWLLLDKAGSSANVLSADVLGEFEAVLAEIENNRPSGLVIRSAKTSGFIAGADITEFTSMRDPIAVEERLDKAHGLFDRLDRLKLPTVAVIHGFCLGGGLELALACDHRIAVDGARFGFPEVLLGLHPGLGGTFRSLALLNPLTAMDMMLTGRTLDARKAKAAGLVDLVTEERHVRAAAKAAIGGTLKAKRPSSLTSSALNLPPVRRMVASRMRRQAEVKAPSAFYPAPYALITLWERFGNDPRILRREEVRSFARLIASDAAQNLIRVFLLRETLKKLAGREHHVHHVHVIGAGAMGGDIAAWCAWQGLSVTLADVSPKPLGAAVKRASALFEKIGRKRTDIRHALDRLTPDLVGSGVAHADIVIEAAPEKLELKRKIFADIEPRMKPTAILATNTSSIPLQELREGLARPERLVGVHFFNPVSRMQLVEVVTHDRLDPEVEAAARAFVGQIDRLPAPVKSAPGFLVNRALTPYLFEAMLLVGEGMKPEEVDEAAERFGMPVGPVELADQVGLDICVSVLEELRAGLDWPVPAVPDWLTTKVAEGDLGRKTGKGFYEWKDGQAVKNKVDAEPSQETTDRLILPMVNMCMACLREGIVANEDIVDAAMIFGTGFAPFLGGPMHYARMRSSSELQARMNALANEHGERFRPDPGWKTFGATAPDTPHPEPA